MKKYKGAVFYVDVLGVGSLTNGTIPLKDIDYIAHKIKKIEFHNHQCFCAKLLINFRKVLFVINNKYKNVKVSQLSDCAFLWSDNYVELINAARECMWGFVRNGVLCRGGMAYGSIVEPDRTNNSIGKFILGKSVTDAVELEKQGKGFRIFTDSTLRKKLSDEIKSKYKPIIEHADFYDFTIKNEFRWYLFDQDMINNNHTDANITKGLAELIEDISSAKFRWNKTTNDGKIHVDCSREAIMSFARKHGLN